MKAFLIARLQQVVISAPLVAVLGCGGYAVTDNPLALEFSNKVMRRYDSNFDGQLTVLELRGWGARGRIKEAYDFDGDGKASRDEIATCIDRWLQEGSMAQGIKVTLTISGRPLAGAQVRIVPDYDPGDGSQAQVTQTDANGVASLEIPLEDLTQAMKNPGFGGVFATNCRVEVTHPKHEIPAEYNTETRIELNLPREEKRRELMLELPSH